MRAQLEVQFLSVSTGRPEVRQPGLRRSLLLPDERGGPRNTLALVQRMHDRAAHRRCRTHLDQPGLADLWERALGKDNTAPEDRPQRNRGSSTRTRERAVRAKPIRCAKNYRLRRGKCVVSQNCGKNAYLKVGGDCHCKNHCEIKGGKCVWKTNKYGFEIEPRLRPSSKSLDRKCKAGMKCGERC